MPNGDAHIGLCIGAKPCSELVLVAVEQAVVVVVIPHSALGTEGLDPPFDVLDDDFALGGRCPPQQFVHQVCHNCGECPDDDDDRHRGQEHVERLQVTHSLYDNFLASSCEA